MAVFPNRADLGDEGLRDRGWKKVHHLVHACFATQFFKPRLHVKAKLWIRMGCRNEKARLGGNVVAQGGLESRIQKHDRFVVDGSLGGVKEVQNLLICASEKLAAMERGWPCRSKAKRAPNHSKRILGNVVGLTDWVKGIGHISCDVRMVKSGNRLPTELIE
jgi:hypothetical protein